MRAMTMDVKRRMISFLATTRRLLGVHMPGYPSETLGGVLVIIDDVIDHMGQDDAGDDAEGAEEAPPETLALFDGVADEVPDVGADQCSRHEERDGADGDEQHVERDALTVV